MFFPYITGRNFTFRILIEIALALWVGLMILDKRYRPKPNLIFWAVTIFVVIVGLADLLGINPYNSFWSRFERMEGYLMFLHLYAYFLIIISVFKTKKEWLTFFNLFLIAGLLVGGYGILQVLGIKEAIQGGGVRIDGTIGNPTYLAVYLIFISALSLLLYFNTGKRWLKYFYLGSLIFNFIVLYFTASRGVALALFITAPIFLLLYILLIKSQTVQEGLYKKLAVAGLAAIVLLPVVFWLVKDAKFVQESDVLSRFAGLSLTDKTIRARFLIWNISLQGFKERPILGWGQENYLRIFSQYFDPRLYDQEPWFDRSHNIIFDWLVNAGIVGLISYLSLFVALFLTLAMAWREKKISPKEGLVLVVLPIAYFIQNLFVFDNFNTYVLFFGILGYLSFFDEKVSATDQNGPLIKRNINLSLFTTPVLLAVILAISYFINFKPLLTARGIISSLQATTDKVDAVNKTLESFRKTLDYNTFGNTEALEQLARITSALISQPVDIKVKSKFFDFTASRIEKHLERFPDDIRLHLFLGSLYNSAGIQINSSYVLNARDHFQKALSLSPTKQDIYYALADNYLRTQEFDKTIDLLQRAVDLEPNNPGAHANKAVAAVLLGRNDLVSQVIQDLNQIRLSANPREEGIALSAFVDSLDKIGNTYILVGDRQNARAIYEQILFFVPNSARFLDILEEL